MKRKMFGMAFAAALGWSFGQLMYDVFTYIVVDSGKKKDKKERVDFKDFYEREV